MTEDGREARGRDVDDAALEKHRSHSSHGSDGMVERSERRKRRTWQIGMLNDRHTDEVPGSVLLLSQVSKYNAPLGLNDVPNRRPSNASLPSLFSVRSRAMFSQRPAPIPEKKRTKDGKIILEPQPEESGNDPLNWSTVRRDVALVCLGFYCMIGGGMTPILAAGFTNVAETFNVSIPDVARTTGLYMLGLGIGSVVASPTAIAFGKRPVYLVGSLLFVLSSVWCALSPNYASLVVARVFMGLAVSPVECLPSATIAEIFFLHERAYRLGIYTLLLLGGKNLIPLVSAAIIQGLGWRWVFWTVAIIVGFAAILLFFFVPETFWDRAPIPHKKGHRRPSLSALRRRSGSKPPHSPNPRRHEHAADDWNDAQQSVPVEAKIIGSGEGHHGRHARFAEASGGNEPHDPEKALDHNSPGTRARASFNAQDLDTSIHGSPQQDLQSPQSPVIISASPLSASDVSPQQDQSFVYMENSKRAQYTTHYRSQPPKTFAQTLKPYSGRLNHDNWFRVAFRPFILFAYPAILWSAAVYALSVGWLIVLSESVSTIYRSADTYNFNAIQVGLVYISPFVGGILGTAVAGKVSDIIVRFMARKNEGIYEPEFRLVMALPVALTTAIGLMGFGWSAQERDNFWVPTIFFGVISFGCSLGSTTAITFAVDSYRQYAGEALVTLNFSKNIFHGLVFSLFFNSWLESDGAKDVFVALGGIQIFFLLWTVPLYIFGKRLRMWTVRKKMMEKF